MKIKIVIPIIIVAFIGLLVGMFIFQTNELSYQLEADELGILRLTELENGSYTGAYESSLVSAQVEVEVHDHKIVEIKIIRHDTMFGKEAENIIEDIIHTQSLEVDDIAGATYSSKVIKRAIEDALANY